MNQTEDKSEVPPEFSRISLCDIIIDNEEPSESTPSSPSGSDVLLLSFKEEAFDRPVETYNLNDELASAPDESVPTAYERMEGALPEKEDGPDERSEGTDVTDPNDPVSTKSTAMHAFHSVS